MGGIPRYVCSESKDKHMKTQIKALALGGLVLATAATVFAFTPGTNDNMVQVKIIKEVDGIVTMKDTVLKDDGNLKLHEVLMACNVISDVKIMEHVEGLDGHQKGKRRVMVIAHEDVKDGEKMEWKEEKKEVEIRKEVDDKGNVKITRTVNGKTEEISEEELEKMHKEIMAKHHKDVNIDKKVTVEMDEEEDVKILGNENKIVMQKRVVVEENGERSEHTEKVTVIITRDVDKLPAGVAAVKKPIADVNVDFYPNPTTGQFKLTFKLESEDQTEIQIYDMNGKRVYHESIGDFKGSYSKDIDISGSGKGTYFLRISQGKNGITKKVVVH